MSEENERDWAALCAALWPDHSADVWMQRRADGKHPFEYLYRLGNEAVAFVGLSLRHDYVEGTDTSPVGYVEGIYVKPGHRGKGIARELVEYAKEWALERGCGELASDCEIGNAASRAFHNGIGFREANTIVCFAMKL
ncbi:MAG: GNAT family N-acetyltransferase [Clostridia bacterium]|nr:GNAT family N-acetyltransferase [Clostridia bacterium]